GDASKTTISGVVFDNSDVPIPGITVRAVLTNLFNSNSNIIQMAASAQTDAQGQFTIQQAPVGFVKLLVDGSTAQRPGRFPTLDYEMVTVAGQNNTLGQVIYLLPLNTGNQLCVTATTGGGTLTVPEAPGFSLTFGPGQVTFPGGSKEGCVNVTVVHSDKVPMAPGFGQQPRFIVTIQPAGAVFNPPAAITLPNVDGLKPREVTEMYSFDHDIRSFVAIGTGVVSDDGQVIRSSPGVGVLKAGWHCGGNPTQSGNCDNDPCKKAAQDARDLANRSQGFFDNTSIFANIQACIAEQSCQNKPNLENPDWLDKVLPDFINKWKDETGAWPFVRAACQSFTFDPRTLPIRKELCAALMATYHINLDLKGTLVDFGCGTDSDFMKIGDIIRNCTNQNLSFPFNEIAKPIVDFMRDFIHDQCIEERRRRGLPPN
ncbi:MAG TPA: carboxypeptidase-like regulatory domain-containing protein, partial [Blastocatellia bacterium]|nr:carboxypeptidase-like regulatory domain-containing protein [Blastocatellia bacterium]